MMLKGDSGPWVASLAGVGMSAAAGFLSGLLIVALRVHPFIVTLGTMGILRGVAGGLAKQQKIDAPAKGLDDLLAVLPPNKSWMLVPAGVWTFVAVALLIAFVLRYTAFGRHVFAIGSNEQTARLCGIRVPWVKVAVYTLAGLLAGVAGVMEFGTLTVGDPTDSLGLELDVIAAVVIGGGSLSGGEGSILGSLIGAFLMTVIKTGAVYVGLPSWVQLIITGVIIVLAVAADRIRHRRT
jgi:ribose transport system permease protein